ncbi:MAG: hypothetical protein IPM54_37550 [Polyangiaceae bacterium]|nr:hypothetical protein [Polyangiaceae bacterium]
MDPKGSATVGYLLVWSGLGGLALSPDIEVSNPFSSPGQRVLSGARVKCIGLLESLRFAGEEDDPMRFVAWVSQGTAANIRAKIARPLSSTKLEMVFYIISYDEEKKQWFEAGLVKDGGRMKAALDTTGGEVQIFISNKPTRIAENSETRVYKFEFQVVPAAGETSIVEFALGPTQRFVKKWGAAEG